MSRLVAIIDPVDIFCESNVAKKMAAVRLVTYWIRATYTLPVGELGDRWPAYTDGDLEVGVARHGGRIDYGGGLE